VTRRLLHINLKNDIEGLHEVRSLMNEVREAWSIIPSKMAAMRVTS
jgi:flagellin-specific chaperone FliS